ncbi:hypothetical protein ACJRO7_001219 [Eucalyptus globulus]|uniref:Uncharacterized protein n=1 Tax=Eucalyptus globulus TaxID=34317 RepID=A0ABD3LQB0_EUCGL
MAGLKSRKGVVPASTTDVLFPEACDIAKFVHTLNWAINFIIMIMIRAESMRPFLGTFKALLLSTLITYALSVASVLLVYRETMRVSEKICRHLSMVLTAANTAVMLVLGQIYVL